ncbi:MAG: amidohydrolase [Candidatus Aminicenantes bacterium]|nr:amidohydrolase [Candidatus Aminicenantes bacterium]
MKKVSFLVLFVALVCPSFGTDFDLISHFKKKANEYFDEAVQLRRHLHQYPELCFQEKQTSAFVANYLTKLGLDVQTGIAGVGIKAILRGTKKKPVVAIRAEMDALPISEETGFPYSSKNKGKMHACGHDAHMTHVLITAKILSEIREKIPGTVVFIFQPCEEGPPPNQPGGAELMIQEGALKNPTVNAMLGLHVFPDIPVGCIGLRKGPIMANVASFYINIYGKSSHGAFPHQGIDAIYVACCAIQQFQSLISRLRDPTEPAVLSVGKIGGGVRVNVIAEKVELEGTVRTFSFEFQDKIYRGMKNILEGLSTAYGTTYRFIFSKDAPYVKNDESLTGFLIPVFKKILGETQVLDVKPMSIGEDFSYYSHRIPSVFFFLGIGDKPPLHTPSFTVDERIFKIAPVLFASAAIHYLNNYSRK